MSKIEKLYSYFGILTMVLVIGASSLYINNQFDDAQTINPNYGGMDINKVTLVGASTDAERLPNVYVFDNSTTTNADIDGGTITQLVDTRGSDIVNLCIQAIGGTATSTLSIRQMGSYDSSNFFDISPTSTKTLTVYSPTTTTTLEPKTPISFDPGTATTTGKCFPVDTYGYSYTRFLLMGEDVSTDPNDGVQAWIDVFKVELF